MLFVLDFEGIIYHPIFLLFLFLEALSLFLSLSSALSLSGMRSGGGVVACPVMQAYGSLTLEENLEVGEVVLDRCSIPCVCTSAF